MNTHVKPRLRRKNPGRVAARNRTAKDAAQNKGGRERIEGGAVRPVAAVAITATGILIPQLSKEIPSAFEAGETKGLPSLIRELVELGGLTNESVGSDINNLIEEGFEAICNKGIKSIEGQTGYDPTLFINGGGLHLDVHQNCHTWKLALEPIVTALSGADLADFIIALNTSVAQGPWYWSEMVGWAKSEIRDGDMDEEKERPTNGRPVPEGDPDEWLRALVEAQPALADSPKRSTMLKIERGRPAPEELLVLTRAFIATSEAVQPYCGSHAFLVTCWNHDDCRINHAHDALQSAMNRGDWDEDHGEAFEVHGQGMKEIKAAMDVVGAFITAVMALDNWSTEKLKAKTLCQVLK